MTTVGVAVPSIPTRSPLLARALRSVCAQTRIPDAISVAVDHERAGAAVTRNGAWRSLDTDWVAFLDDDDELLPHHLSTLLAIAVGTGADMVHPWFEVEGGTDPFPQHRGRTFDPADPHQTTITCLWRRSTLDALGGFAEPGDTTDPAGHRAGEDFDLVVRAAAAGAVIMATAEITWRWHHHSANTSGLPSRW